MYVHIVMMEFSPDASTTFLQNVEDYAVRIRAECTGVTIYHFAPNEAARSQGYTHAVISGFRDINAHDAYQVSAVHLEMKTYMGPFIQSLVVFDGVAPML